MSVPSLLTAEQKRGLVYAYVAAPYGSKGEYLREHGVTDRQMRTWRAQVFAGTLELGLIPRGGAMVSPEESAALARLIKENRSLQEQLAAQQVEHEQAVAAKDAELAVQLRAVDALGKAIAILHHTGAGKSSQQHRAEEDQ
jgi:transposase-like protein